ncbi:MAG: Holliday junction resolvase RuvX [Candidatus Neomarinimicrobiota bacterium]|jgi:putative Holliday junction resolvase|nr:Holliday junction resolvase RuvX [Candidatus Neomarinimicrobiota bacterium]MDD3965853.1 Holliday junction resolvase RuvX [Candidatus Neomarinimicrobiota bacterium]MDX9779977.1 Holliday junction resolvase RuvX [bacterium]
MRRVLAIDFGERRIGIAVSDPLQIIATPLNTLNIRSLDDGVSQVLEICREYTPERIIVGYPIGISGRKTAQTLRVESFMDKLRSLQDIPILQWDERYTSMEALDRLHEQGIKIRSNKDKIDQMAARIILQEYLDTRITE